eukprot:COSAG03_NODE_1218_length_4536_cov_15.567275_4_plen_92_part_00
MIANAKHWVNNNQETNRHFVSEIVDERTRYELYYPPFAGAVESGAISLQLVPNELLSLGVANLRMEPPTHFIYLGVKTEWSLTVRTCGTQM